MAPVCGERSGICQRRNTNHSLEIVQRHTETPKVTELDQADSVLSTTSPQSPFPTQSYTPKQHCTRDIASPIHRRSSGGDSSAAVGISLGVVFFVVSLLIMCYLYCRTCHKSSAKKPKKDKDKKKDKKKGKKDKDKKGKKKDGKKKDKGKGKKQRHNCPRQRDYDPARTLREWLAQNPEFVANTMPRMPRQAYMQGRGDEYRPVNEMDAPRMVYSDEEEEVAHNTDNWLMWTWYLANGDRCRHSSSDSSSSGGSSSS